MRDPLSYSSFRIYVSNRCICYRLHTAWPLLLLNCEEVLTPLQQLQTLRLDSVHSLRAVFDGVPALRRSHPDCYEWWGLRMIQ